MTAPREIFTDRLVLRPPCMADAEAVFERYASDPEATRYMSFARHRTVDDARQFVERALLDWERERAFAYLAFLREGGPLVGSAGIVFEAPERASTGYVLARDAWGRGLATEMTGAMVDVAFGFPDLWRLYAICHVGHRASEGVLAKAGFEREGTMRRHEVFPNLGTGEAQDVALWARVRAGRVVSPD